MENKYTQGPWKIVRDDSDFIKGVEVDNGWICDTQFNSVESCEANAKLIAAAPELLEALTALVEYCKYHDIRLGSGIVHQIETAINKATE